MTPSRSLSFVATVLTISSTLAVVGCSSSGASDASPCNADHPAASPTAQGTAGGDDPATASIDVDAGCTKYFDALVARKTRCGNGKPILGLDAFEGARESFMAVCRQRSARSGTGYTPAFHESCATAFNDAACDDYDMIVRACWEPRGALAAGAPCSTDDQCRDGYCKLPSEAKLGSTCGACAVPTWGRLGASCATNNVKCVPGSVCVSSYAYSTPQCIVVGSDYANEGEACSDSSPYRHCARGLFCKSEKCVPQTIVPLGGNCREDDVTCEENAECLSLGSGSYSCVKTPGLGDECGPGLGWCDGWASCGATNKCELKQPDLTCSSATATTTSDEPKKCAGAATSCSSRAAGTCSAQDGCSFVQHYRTGPSGGYLESVCEGTAKACTAISSETACMSQSGCRWE